MIDYLWQVLHGDDRAMFLSRYSAAWMAHRVSIPAENAARLVGLAKAGRLTFRTGPASVSHDQPDGFTISTCGAEGISSVDHFDMVVGAMGTPRNAAKLDSPLIQSMLESRLARGHEYGGLDVDPLTNALVDADGEPSDQISVLGELTAGIHFFTSVLEINARYAARLASRIFRQSMDISENLAKPLSTDLTFVPHAGYPQVPMDLHHAG